MHDEPFVPDQLKPGEGTPFTFAARNRKGLLIVTMITVVFFSVTAAFMLLYNAAFEKQHTHLRQTATSQVRLIESIDRYYSTTEEATLAIMRDAHQNYHSHGDGKQGELSVARRDGDEIVFLLKHHRGEQHEKRIPFDLELAMPMRNALLGKSGTMIGVDYLGKDVLAAYEPLHNYGWGLVVKADLDEIRAPFLNAGFIVLGLTLLLVWFGSALMNRIHNPLIRRLQRSAERNKALINTSLSIIYATEAAGSFKQTYISDNVKEILGFESKCMINEPDFWINHVHPDDRQRVFMAIQDVSRADQLVLEYRIRDKWGKYHWIQDSGHLLRDEAGRPREVVGSWADVSDIKQATDELMRQKEYSDNLLQNLSVPTFVINASHEVMYWNKACERLTGISAEKIIGTNGHWQGFYSEQRPCLADLLLNENKNDADSLFSKYERSTLVSQGIHAENWCTLANNKRHYLVFEAGPIYDRDGEMIAAVETLRDLTEHKSLEIELLYSRDTALKAAKAKGEFLANMSHEIRTPMNAVLGMLQLVKNTKLSAEQQDFIDTAYNSADALLTIINDILDFSKIEAGMMEMEKIDTDVREIVSDVSTLLSPKTAEKG
ncbi:MAG: PAS domain-containing protein, partial [Gammaproteobacteria bacterium]